MEGRPALRRRADSRRSRCSAPFSLDATRRSPGDRVAKIAQTEQVFKTCAVVYPTARSVRLRRRSVKGIARLHAGFRQPARGGAERSACPLSSVAIRPVEQCAFPQLSRTSCKEVPVRKRPWATGVDVVIVGSGLASVQDRHDAVPASMRMRSPVLISLVPVPVPTMAAPSWRALRTVDEPRPAPCGAGLGSREGTAVTSRVEAEPPALAVHAVHGR